MGSSAAVTINSGDRPVSSSVGSTPATVYAFEATTSCSPPKEKEGFLSATKMGFYIHPTQGHTQTRGAARWNSRSVLERLGKGIGSEGQNS